MFYGNNLVGIVQVDKKNYTAIDSGNWLYTKVKKQKQKNNHSSGKTDEKQIKKKTIKYLLILIYVGALEVLNGNLGKKLENSASYHLHSINKRIEIEERLSNWTEVAR